MRWAEVFFDDVQEIKKAMSSIRYNIRQIEQNHGECLTAISAEQGRASTDRLDDLMRTTNATATQVSPCMAGGAHRSGGRAALRVSAVSHAMAGAQ